MPNAPAPEPVVTSRNNIETGKRMDWDIADFTVFGGMLLGVAVSYRFLRHKASNRAYRLAAAVSLAAAFILVWANLAVGIIGHQSNDANAMYFAVLGVAIVGAVLSRFQPLGMMRTMYATAMAQVGVGAIALLARLGSQAPAWPRDILILTAFFVALWLLSGRLFRRAYQQLPAMIGVKPES